MKKSLIGLLCVSACCLAGCGKGLTTEEACKFADDNWVTGEAAVKKDVKVKSVVKVKKATGVFEKLGVEDEEDEDTTTVTAANSTYIAALGAEGYEFSTFLGKLYADYELDSKELAKEFDMDNIDSKYFEGEGSGHMVFNKEGFLVKEETKMEFSINYVEGILNIVGELSVSATVTYSL